MRARGDLKCFVAPPKDLGMGEVFCMHKCQVWGERPSRLSLFLDFHDSKLLYLMLESSFQADICRAKDFPVHSYIEGDITFRS